ncbi:response regulator [Ancylobacter sp. A5.8]|uniref:response regulator n=1 Tax=Ancylobacter gelatini TaxID=2919920 RepID=UPI001F4DBCFF|nr:response regulator [Ancylobacter gelatini]MCJ8141774.1 response regulator [Ancylobacter gelatini]
MGETRPLAAIVDDDPRLIESLQDLLESAGYRTINFRSAEALLGSGLATVDVLITDIGLPGADGFALRDAVKRQHPELPVILISGRYEFADDKRAQVTGDFFRKPFNAQDLLSAIGNAVHSRKTGG